MLAPEINLKVCAPTVRTRNLPVDPGIEPHLL